MCLLLDEVVVHRIPRRHICHEKCMLKANGQPATEWLTIGRSLQSLIQCAMIYYGNSIICTPTIAQVENQIQKWNCVGNFFIIHRSIYVRWYLSRIIRFHNRRHRVSLTKNLEETSLKMVKSSLIISLDIQSVHHCQHSIHCFTNKCRIMLWVPVSLKWFIEIRNSH